MLTSLNTFKNLPIWMKQGLITLLILVPLVGLLYGFLTAQQESIAFAQKELRGVEYIVALKSLFVHLPQHRGLAAAILTGSPEQKDRLLIVQASIDADFKAIEAVDQRLGNALDTTAKLQAITQRWQELKLKGLDLKPAESFEQYTQLVTDIMVLMQHVGDRSNLILDPYLDSYYLVDTVINKLPTIIEQLGKLGGLGSSVAARKTRKLEDRIQLQLLIGQVRSSLEGLQRNLQVMYKERPELERKLTPAVTRALEGTDTFLNLVDERIIQAETINVPLLEYFTAGTETAARFLTLHDDTFVQLRGLLEARIGRLTTNRNLQSTLALILVVLAVAAALAMHRLIIRQIRAIVDLFEPIGAGNYEVRAGVFSGDELGTMATSLNAMLDVMRDQTLSLLRSKEEHDAMQIAITKLLDEVSDVASGDLSVEAEVTADMTGAIADAFNYMLHQLRTIVAQVQEAAVQVSASAHEIQTTAEHLAHGSTTQATQIVESSAALDEMAVSIQDVSEHATLSATVAEQALANAKQGALAVRTTIQAMHRMRTQAQETARRIKRLGERSQEIGEIVQLIGDIADRTSIVALNASIQAARAGEAGRAFVVVAEEVERLAERAANATRQIASLVNTIQSETNEAVTAMEDSTHEVVEGSRLADQAGHALGEIESVSTRLAELIQSISLAAKQQARGSENLSKAMGDISEVTQQTASGVKQAAVSINNLAGLADELRGAVSTFKLPGIMNGHRARV
jgi:methyl-accepting chemotaxis protein